MDRRGFLKRCGLLPFIGSLATVAQAEAKQEHFEGYPVPQVYKITDAIQSMEKCLQEENKILSDAPWKANDKAPTEKSEEVVITFYYYAQIGEPVKETIRRAIWVAEANGLGVTAIFCGKYLWERIKYEWKAAQKILYPYDGIEAWGIKIDGRYVLLRDSLLPHELVFEGVKRSIR